jgi:predicted HD phosphohydrolase
MATMTDAYLSRVEDALADDLALVPDRILATLRSLAALQQGFVVDQLEHSLQTATRAERAGADLDIVVASLCHDMGKALTNVNHPAIAAEMIKPWVSADAYWMVQVHQDFQGLHYYARMGLDPMMRRRHTGHPAYELAERFADEWDQTAFDPDYDSLPLEHFEPMVRQVFTRAPRR